MEKRKSLKKRGMFTTSSVELFRNGDISGILEEFELGIMPSVEEFDELVQSTRSNVKQKSQIPAVSLPPVRNRSQLKILEKQQRITANFIEKQAEVTPSMRVMLLDWMDHAHMYLGIETASFYMAVAIIDAYLAVVANVDLNLFQLVGIAALRLATKSIETNVPKIEEYLRITGDIFTTKRVEGMEKKILSVLGCELPSPLSYEFLRYLIRQMDIDKPVELLSLSFLELATFDAEIVVQKPSKLAASSLLIAMHLQRATSNIENKDTAWTEDLVKYSGYALEHLQSTAHEIALVALKAPHHNLTAVIKKYASNDDADDELYQLVTKMVIKSSRDLNH